MAEGRGRLAEDRHLLVEQQLVKGVRGPAHPVRHHHQAPAVEQRAPQLPDGEVERVGVEERPDIVAIEMIPGVRRGEEPSHVVVLDQRPLGPPRLSPRYMKKSHGPAVFEGARRGLVGKALPSSVSRTRWASGAGIQPLCAVPVTSTRILQVLHHEGQAVADTPDRAADRRPRLENTEDPDHHRERALHAEAHQRVRPNPQAAQVVREAIGSLVQGAIAELGRSRRRSPRAPVDLGLEGARERRRHVDTHL